MKTILILLALIAAPFIYSPAIADDVETEIPAEVQDFVNAQVDMGQWSVADAETAVTNYQVYVVRNAANVDGTGPFDFLKFGKRRNSHAHFKSGHHPIKCPNGRCH